MPHRFKELHYIIHIEHIGSVINYGILSHEEVERKGLKHHDISNAEVQNLRAGKSVPNGLKMHQYVPTYFDARNAMLFDLKDDPNLCVLRISKNVLVDIPGAVAYDMNASKKLAKLIRVDEIGSLNFDLIYARSWNDPDPNQKAIKKAIRQAEVHIPHKIMYNYIIGAYVANSIVKRLLLTLGFNKDITVNPDLFFNGGNDDKG